MNRQFGLFVLLIFLFVFLQPASAEDLNQPAQHSIKATEGVYDSGVYKGLSIETPIGKATPVPWYLLNHPQFFIASSPAAATVSAYAIVYYGPSQAYALRGTFASSKTVKVIEKEDNYYLIEYIVNGGSVRGYVQGSALTGSLGAVPAANHNIVLFGLNVSGAAAVVYGGPGSTAYIQIGSVDKREIITVLNAYSSNWYQIEYSTSSGNKRGYIETSKVRVPGLNFSMSVPARTGTRTCDYGSLHNGIDIGAAAGTPIYAITSGTAKYRTAYEVENGKRVMVSYGNFVELRFNGKIAYYSHLSSFENGFTAMAYPNANPVRGISSKTKYIEHGTITITKPGTLLGCTGNTGNSAGAHLHFEVREDSKTIVDPFKYILFTQMPY